MNSLPEPANPKPTSVPSVLGLPSSGQSPVVRVGDLERKSWRGWHSAKLRLYRWVLGNAQRWYTLLSTFRSFRGHIQTIRTIEHQSVDLGPAVQRSPDGHFLPCTRTVAHSHGIRCLRTMYPWADLVDVQVFLLGFGEGAKWVERNACSASSTPVAAYDSSMLTGEAQSVSKRDP